MNKRLTDMDRREWGKSLILLLESEKAGWEEVERLKEEKERILKQMEHLVNKPIAVFGEGFGYEEHYRWLKDDLKSLVASIQRIQEGRAE